MQTCDYEPQKKDYTIIAPICPEETPRTIPDTIKPDYDHTTKTAQNQVSMSRPSLADYYSLR